MFIRLDLTSHDIKSINSFTNTQTHSCAMNSLNDLLDAPNREAWLAKTRHATHSAMSHWFVCNQGVQRNYWPSVYKSTHQADGLRSPTGVVSTYWDTLAHAERQWVANPAKSQFGDQLNDFWHDHLSATPAESAENNVVSRTGQRVNIVDEQVVASDTLKAVSHIELSPTQSLSLVATSSDQTAGRFTDRQLIQRAQIGLSSAA